MKQFNRDMTISTICLMVLITILGCSGYSKVAKPNMTRYLISSDQVNQLKYYVDVYAKERKKNLKSMKPNYTIRIRLTDLYREFGNTDLAGRCLKNTNPRQIVLDEAHWVSLTDRAKLMLMFHELGHCDLDLSHEQNTIMHPNLSYLPEDFTKAMNDLFKRYLNRKGEVL